MVSNNLRMQTWQQKLIDALTGTNASYSSLLFVVVLGLGLALRLMDIDRAFYGYHMWNEAYYVTIARNFNHAGFFNLFNYDWRGGSALSQRYGPSPIVSWLIYFSSLVFGNSEAAARLPILILGMVSLVAVYFIARELYDSEIALIAGFLAAIMPGVIFISRQIALDSPMVAFGLVSVWILLYGGRRHQWGWMLVSSLLLGVAVNIKYTAVLFVPLIAWIWLKMILRGDFTRGWHKWLLPAGYFLIAALPALAWMARGVIISSPTHAGESPVTSYLLRSYEWDLNSWRWALLATWDRTRDQVGHMLWYLMVVAVIASIATGKILRFAKQHIEVLLLILPWFAQMIYPVSWYQNDGYTYPILYGVAILLALIVRQVILRGRELLNPSNRQMFLSVSLLVLTLLFSNLWDYRQVYRSWYTISYSSFWVFQEPANLVSPYNPNASAQMVRNLNTSHASILADEPGTLYYAQDDYWQAKATWYWWGLQGERDKLVAAIQSREYTFVVFTYQPPLEVVTALGQNGYRHVDLGVWQKE